MPPLPALVFVVVSLRVHSMYNLIIRSLLPILSDSLLRVLV
jgi:hypothetical protein